MTELFKMKFDDLPLFGTKISPRQNSVRDKLSLRQNLVRDKIQEFFSRQNFLSGKNFYWKKNCQKKNSQICL